MSSPSPHYPYDPRRPLPVRPTPSAATTVVIVVVVIFVGLALGLLMLLYYYRDTMLVVELKETIMTCFGEALVHLLESSWGQRLFPGVDIEKIKRRCGIDEASRVAFSWMVKEGGRSEAEDISQEDYRLSENRSDLLYGDPFEVYPISNWQAMQSDKVVSSWMMDVPDGGDTSWCHHRKGQEDIIIIPSEEARTVLSNMAVPLQPLCIVEFTLKTMPVEVIVYLGLSIRPTPQAEYAGHVPCSVGYSSEGLIYSGDWRLYQESLVGGYGNGDVITMIIDRKADGAKRCGGVYFMKNGKLCTAVAATIESLKLPSVDDEMEPPPPPSVDDQVDCERMIFGYVKGRVDHYLLGWNSEG